MISDAVYANSTTMNGQHFADEFIRRKKLAERGVVERQPSSLGGGDSRTGGAFSSSASAGGGWSEVAKKGGHSSSAAGREQSSDAIVGAGFKVVPSRKKGGKK
jgi:PERQ amino acid-rich with GYF domain-containing protein